MARKLKLFNENLAESVEILQNVYCMSVCRKYEKM